MPLFSRSQSVPAGFASRDDQALISFGGIESSIVAFGRQV